MKKTLAVLLSLSMVATVAAGCGKKETPSTPATEAQKTEAPAPAETEAKKEEAKEEEKDYSDYTIRIYSNSNSTERTTWLVNEAKEAGFTISIDAVSYTHLDVYKRQVWD